MTRAGQVTEACANHGEGPMWDPFTGQLHWVDMLAGDVLILGRRGGVSRRHLAPAVAAIRPRVGGGLVLALERSFALLGKERSALTVCDEIWTDPGIRMNDGGCDPQGRFYCGSMAGDATPGAGALYRFDPDGSVHRVLDAVTISNGLAWSPCGQQVYYIDSATQRVDAFDFDATDGMFRNRRTAIEIDADCGTPDGMAVDVEGGVWVALWTGACVHRYLPDGRLTDVIELPLGVCATACAFGGPDLMDLYITTSRLGGPPAAASPAGALFRATPGVAGLPVIPFAG